MTTLDYTSSERKPFNVWKLVAILSLACLLGAVLLIVRLVQDLDYVTNALGHR